MMSERADILLDLLDAMTEVRVSNPEFRASVLSVLRLAMSIGLLRSGRLYSLHRDHRVKAIIAHGPEGQDEEADLALVAAVAEDRSIIRRDTIAAYPLGKDRHLFGVLLVDDVADDVGRFLADIFLQWHAVAEFIDIEKAELVDENYQLRQEINTQFSDEHIVGVSGRFRQVVDSAVRVARSVATVLIQGETGTGKELIARLIHTHSPRANRPFVAVNCGALNDGLLETELFGHAKGAFTGALSDRKGRFEAAHGGTLFLDEIGEVSPAMQVRLLRVLQEMEVVRVGENQVRKLDVRIIAASNRDLLEEVRAGRFREDLFFRLNVVTLVIPPLRQRTEDISALFEHFLNYHCRRNCRYIRHVDREVFELMRQYHWPGNVRELENYVEKMVVLAPGDEISADLVPISLAAYAGAPVDGIAAVDFDRLARQHLRQQIGASIAAGRDDLYDQVRERWECYLLRELMEVVDDNKSRAAQALGITRSTLLNRLRAYSDLNRTWND